MHTNSMADHSRSSSLDLNNILGLGGVCKACKSFMSKCYQDKNSSPKKAQAEDKPKSIEEEYKVHKLSNYKHENTNDMQELRYITGEGSSPRGILNRRSYENNYFTRSPLSSPPISRSTSPLHSRSPSPSPLSRSTSKRSRTPIHSAGSRLLRSLSRRNSVDAAAADNGNSRSLSRSASRRSSTPIMYSNSSGLIKPPAMEKTLECTLEELCFGCIKKIKITRDAVTNNGQIIEEDEVLTIKVKPGWRKGTKITFEGMGNETPGALPADVIFRIAEKEHLLYRREADDLEFAVKIPLVKALTGCSLPIHLLGGETMSLTIDDVVYPGYKKIVAGEGMPKPDEQGKRGNLIVKILIEFPTELTDEQRSDLFSILQDSG